MVMILGGTSMTTIIAYVLAIAARCYVIRHRGHIRANFMHIMPRQTFQETILATLIPTRACFQNTIFELEYRLLFNSLN